MIEVLKNTFSLVRQFPGGSKTGMVQVRFNGEIHNLKAVIPGETNLMFVNAQGLGRGVIEIKV